jgi:hypothetical protein
MINVKQKRGRTLNSKPKKRERGHRPGMPEGPSGANASEEADDAALSRIAAAA